MVKFLGILSLIGLGVFVFINPKFSGRGGITDLSYMNLNILIGCILISFGLLLLLREHNRKGK